MRKSLFICIILIVTISFSSCIQTQDVKKDKAESVRVILDYLPNTNHTGMYVALEKGYYEQANLDVEIIEPADGVTSTLIAAGKGDFGISYQEDVTYALTSKEPLPLKAIAAIVQHNTSGFGSVKEKNINTPKDFEGKTYAGWGSPAEEAVIKALVEKEGGDFNKVKMTSMDMAGYSVLKDKVDFIWMFWAWDGISAKREGLDINYMELKELDKRLDYYTPLIIANDDTLNNKKEMTKAFLSATRKGYEYAIKNPIESAEILHKYAGDVNLEFLKESQEYISKKYSEGSDTWGKMKKTTWDNYTEFMFERKLINEKISSESCFTNEFLEEK